MRTQLRCILLIDDDEITNFLNRQTISDANITCEVEVAETAVEALQLLSIPQNENCKIPDLIFLDLNMPGLSGWDFIDELRKLKFPTLPIIVVLTTSKNPDEMKRAKSISEIAQLRNKPLTLSMIDEIMKEYFNH